MEREISFQQRCEHSERRWQFAGHEQKQHCGGWREISTFGSKKKASSLTHQAHRHHHLVPQISQNHPNNSGIKICIKCIIKIRSIFLFRYLFIRQFLIWQKNSAEIHNRKRCPGQARISTQLEGYFFPSYTYGLLAAICCFREQCHNVNLFITALPVVGFRRFFFFFASHYRSIWLRHW